MSQDPSSRHEGVPCYQVVPAPGAEPVTLREPRSIPRPPASLLHPVVGTDRLDLLANRYFGDPLQYWRIADANPTLVPEDMLDPGVQIAIPAKK